MERVKPLRRAGAGDYFPPETELFIPSGCTVLDCAATGGGARSLAGAWPLGKIVNIVGDKSVGKTLLAIEACANFARIYPHGRIRYRESEAAFSVHYAANLGLPLDRIDFGPKGIDSLWTTVEDIFEDLRAALETDREDGVPSLYIVDSLDAVGSRKLIGRDLNQGTYATAKAKVLSEMFSELAKHFKAVSMCVIFISQIRDKIGVTFGERTTRSGGHALNFYASHIVFLSHIATIYKSRGNVKRAVGVRIRAKFKKNKISEPFRECEFVLRFSYGVDDLAASVNWLKAEGDLRVIGLRPSADQAALTKFIAAKEKLPDDEYRAFIVELRKKVVDVWSTVESGFKPTRRKYA